MAGGGVKEWKIGRGGILWKLVGGSGVGGDPNLVADREELVQMNGN